MTAASLVARPRRRIADRGFCAPGGGRTKRDGRRALARGWPGRTGPAAGAAGRGSGHGRESRAGRPRGRSRGRLGPDRPGGAGRAADRRGAGRDRGRDPARQLGRWPRPRPGHGHRRGPGGGIRRPAVRGRAAPAPDPGRRAARGGPARVVRGGPDRRAGRDTGADPDQRGRQVQDPAPAADYAAPASRSARPGQGPPSQVTGSRSTSCWCSTRCWRRRCWSRSWSASS